ncbi:MAG: hypothetical protein PVI85_08570, partial [Methyloceanibacter sp.]
DAALIGPKTLKPQDEILERRRVSLSGGFGLVGHSRFETGQDCRRTLLPCDTQWKSKKSALGAFGRPARQTAGLYRRL